MAAAEHFLGQTVQLTDAGYYEFAVVQAENAVGAMPTSHLPYLQLGVAQMRLANELLHLGELPEALTLLRDAAGPLREALYLSSNEIDAHKAAAKRFGSKLGSPKARKAGAKSSKELRGLSKTNYYAAVNLRDLLQTKKEIDPEGVVERDAADRKLIANVVDPSANSMLDPDDEYAEEGDPFLGANPQPRTNHFLQRVMGGGAGASDQEQPSDRDLFLENAGVIDWHRSGRAETRRRRRERTTVHHHLESQGGMPGIPESMRGQDRLRNRPEGRGPPGPPAQDSSRRRRAATAPAAGAPGGRFLGEDEDWPGDGADGEQVVPRGSFSLLPPKGAFSAPPAKEDEAEAALTGAAEGTGHGTDFDDGVVDEEVLLGPGADDFVASEPAAKPRPDRDAASESPAKPWPDRDAASESPAKPRPDRDAADQLDPSMQAAAGSCRAEDIAVDASGPSEAAQSQARAALLDCGVVVLRGLLSAPATARAAAAARDLARESAVPRRAAKITRQRRAGHVEVLIPGGRGWDAEGLLVGSGLVPAVCGAAVGRRAVVDSWALHLAIEGGDAWLPDAVESGLAGEAEEHGEVPMYVRQLVAVEDTVVQAVLPRSHTPCGRDCGNLAVSLSLAPGDAMLLHSRVLRRPLQRSTVVEAVWTADLVTLQPLLQSSLGATSRLGDAAYVQALEQEVEALGGNLRQLKPL